MRDPVPGQHLKIAKIEQGGVANLNCIPKITGELQEKLIEPRTELVCGHPVPLELEQEWTGMRLELRLSVGRQHKIIEQLGVKESRIGLTGSRPIAGLLGIARNRDFLPHLEAHLEIFWNLVQVTSELIRGRRSIERRVVPHGPE